MNITEVKKLDVGVKGLTVTGKLLNCYPPSEKPGKTGPFTSQKIQLIEEDTDEKISVWIGNGFVGKEDIGKDIEITTCSLKKYHDELELGTASKSVVTIEREKTVTAASVKESVVPPKSFEEKTKSAIQEVAIIFDIPEFKETLAMGVNIGLSTEDVRAFVISRMIQKDREKWS